MITVTHGTNTLVGFDLDRLRSAVITALARGHADHDIKFRYWDGKAAERIVTYWSPDHHGSVDTPITTRPRAAHPGVIPNSRDVTTSPAAEVCIGS